MPWAHFSAVLKTTANLIEIVLINKTPVTDTCNRKDHLSHLLQLSLDPGYQNVTQGVLSFSFFFSAFSDTDFILRLDTHMVFRSWLATLELSAFPFVSSWRKKTVFTPSIYLHPIFRCFRCLRWCPDNITLASGIAERAEACAVSLELGKLPSNSWTPDGNQGD